MTRSRNHSRREDGRSSQPEPKIPAIESSWFRIDSVLGGDGWLDHLDEVHDERVSEPGALLRSAEHRIARLTEKRWLAWSEQDDMRIRGLCGTIHVIASSPVSGWTPMNTRSKGYLVADLVSHLGRVGRGAVAERRRTLREVAQMALIHAED